MTGRAGPLRPRQEPEAWAVRGATGSLSNEHVVPTWVRKALQIREPVRDQRTDDRGRATVFVFPDLDTGNTTYKAVQRSAQVVSIGPMLQGLARPVNDLSRDALVDDIVYTLALTAIQSRV